jgi:hypothetical protein
MSEAFEIYHEDWRRFVDLHLLFGTDMLFAFVAIPFIMLIQNLRLAKFIETIFNAHIRSSQKFLIFFTILKIDSSS